MAPANAKSRFEAEANALKTLRTGQSIDEVVISLDPLLGLSSEAKAIWRDRLQRTAVDTGQTVAVMTKQVLRLKRSQVDAGSLELTTSGDLDAELRSFVTWIGGGFLGRGDIHSRRIMVAAQWMKARKLRAVLS